MKAAAEKMLSQFGYTPDEIDLLIVDFESENEDIRKQTPQALEQFIQARIDSDWQRNPRDIKRIISRWITHSEVDYSDAARIKNYLDEGFLQYAPGSVVVYRGIALYHEEYIDFLNAVGLSQNPVASKSEHQGWNTVKGVNWCASKTKPWASWSSKATIASGFRSSNRRVYANIVISASAADNDSCFFSIPKALSKVIGDRGQVNLSSWENSSWVGSKKSTKNLSKEIAASEFEYVSTEKLVKISGVLINLNSEYEAEDPDLFDPENPF